MISHSSPDGGKEPLRIGIIGGGPAGLGAAIALSLLSSNSNINIQVSLYERASELREVGAGIRIGYNCWKVLELLYHADEGVRGHQKFGVDHRQVINAVDCVSSLKLISADRNGVTGALLKHVDNAGAFTSAGLPEKYLPRRVRRTRLQRALLRKVPKGVVQLGRKVVGLKDLKSTGVEISFAGGEVETVDLVIGADGIHSVVREHIFRRTHYSFHRSHTGTTIWRTLIPLSTVIHIPNVGTTTTWWHGPSGHVYLSPVDDPTDSDPEQGGPMFEISCRSLIEPAADKERRFSWGIDVSNEKVVRHFKEYDPRVRETMEQVPSGMWKEFSAFAGPRLEKVTAWDGKVALLGDASHPLSGAFGSGAAFALEDGWIIAKAIERTWGQPNALAEALKIFDTIRSPYYVRMYKYLDEQKRITQQNMAKALPGQQRWEAALQAKVGSLGSEEALPWIYRNDIQKVWEAWVEEHPGPADRRVEEKVDPMVPLEDEEGIVDAVARGAILVAPLKG